MQSDTVNTDALLPAPPPPPSENQRTQPSPLQNGVILELKVLSTAAEESMQNQFEGLSKKIQQ